MELALLTCDNQVLRVKGCFFIDFCGFSAKIHQRLERLIPLQRYEPPLQLIICLCILCGTLWVFHCYIIMYTLYLETFATCYFYFTGTQYWLWTHQTLCSFTTGFNRQTEQHFGKIWFRWLSEFEENTSADICHHASCNASTVIACLDPTSYG